MSIIRTTQSYMLKTNKISNIGSVVLDFYSKCEDTRDPYGGNNVDFIGNNTEKNRNAESMNKTIENISNISNISNTEETSDFCLGEVPKSTIFPDSIDNFIGNQAIVKIMKFYLKNNTIPNLLIYGPNGTGKKSLVHLFINQYLNIPMNKILPDSNHSKLMIIDGAINRSKSIVSENLKTCDYNIIRFIKKGENFKKEKEIKKKIIVIYSFNKLTIEAQNALRRVIELNESRVIFLFVSDSLNDIIEALQSRCILMKFNLLNDHEIMGILRIYDNDSKYTNYYKDIIVKSNGDARKAINLFKIIKNIPHLNNDSGNPLNNINNIIGESLYEKVASFFRFCTKSNLENNCDFSCLYSKINNITQSNFNFQDIIDTTIYILEKYDCDTENNHAITDTQVIPENKILRIIEIITDSVKNNSGLINSDIYLYNLLFNIYTVIYN